MNKNSEDLKIIPYTATSLSVVGRFIFMFLLYKNKSTNSLSLIFCVLSIFSSAMWIYYSVQSNDTPHDCTKFDRNIFTFIVRYIYYTQ